VIRENTVKSKLNAREVTIGSVVSIPSSLVAEAMAQAGFDWLFIDMEHGILSLESVHSICQAVNTTSAVPIVRVPWNDPVYVKQVLETGALGVIFPMINSPEEAQLAVQSTRFPPDGIRGIGGQRAMGFGAWFQEYLEIANDLMLVVCQIEHIKAVERIDSILSVPGVDVAFIGANDLSASMGLRGQREHPSVRDAMRRVEEAARKAGVVMGCAEPGADQAKGRIAAGYRFVCVGHDAGILNSSARNIVSQLRG